MNKYIGIAMSAVMVLTATSCSDFNDYNEAYTGESASSKLTLWENISQNESLKNFTTLLKKAGFDDELRASHFYTVWAPLDGTYNSDSIAAQDSTSIMDRFVKNHIAEYNWGVSGGMDHEHVHALNQKMFIFNGSGTDFTYDDKRIVNLNQPSVNGVFHTMNGAAAFHKNIYEYVRDASGSDSVKSYYKHYESTYLNESQSVIGPIVNGKQTYIDSVMVTTNALFSRMRTYITNEDSNYTMLIPTDAAWKTAYSKIKPYYNYIKKTVAENITDLATVQTTKTVDNAYFTDSLVKSSIVRNLVFNNNFSYNRWVVNPSELNTDTILTTTGLLLAQAKNILAPTASIVPMSNGYGRIIDSLAVHPWDSWSSDIRVSATNSTYRPKVSSATVSTVRISETNLDTSKGTNLYSYADIKPTSASGNPVVYFYLPNVLSIPYNIYVVYVPANIVKGSTVASKSCKVNYKLRYCTSAGAMAEKDFGIKYNDSTKVDTMLVGTFTFPVCYQGLGSYYPSLTLTSKRSTFSASDKKLYDNEMRIAAILLKPVEHEIFEDKLTK